MRWIVRLLAAVVVFVVILAAGVMLVPTGRIAALAAKQFQEATGRSLTLVGDPRPTLWPVLGVRTGAIAIANADWSGSGPMLEAEGLVIGLKTAALLRGEVAIDELVLDRPTIRLERNASGTGNWEIGRAAPAAPGPAAAPAGAAAPAPAFAIDRARIAGGTLSFTDRASGTALALADLDLDAALPRFSGPATLTGSAVMNGTPVTLDARLGSFADALAGRLSALDLRLAAAGGRISFDGHAGHAPLAADGRLDAEVPDLAALLRALGLPAPDLPGGLGRDIAAGGQLTLPDAAALHLRGGRFAAGGTRLAGDLDLALGARPRLVARLTADALDLSRLAGAGSGGAAAPAPAPAAGWSRAPIDVSALGLLDAEVALTAASVDLGSARLGQTDLVARLDRARLVLDLRRIDAYEGRLSGEFVVNGRGGLSVGGNLTLAGLKLLPFLTEFADYRRLVGTADGRIRFLGVGNSMDAIMRSLSGEGSLALGRGEILGLDLAGMIRNLDASYQGQGAKTVFDSITAGFTIADGVLANEDLVFDAPLLRATGSGTVDLGERRVAYRVTPVIGARRDDPAARGIAVPVLISGPWANLSFRPDLEGMLEQRLDGEKARLEAEARAAAKAKEEELRAEAKRREEDLRARAKAKLEAEIGPVQPGESLEDAARRKLEEEAKKGLQRLLGGR